MKQTSSFFVGLALMLSCGAPMPHVASAQPKVVAPNAPAPASLEIQISAPVKKDGSRVLILDPIQPHFSVILRNVSDKPFQIYEESNSWGYNNVHLEITGVNGKVLAKPLMVSKGMTSFFRNRQSTETLDPNQVVVREITLHIPKSDDQFLPFGHDYWRFPFPQKSGRNTVTMKAVFEIKDENSTISGLWTGRIESVPLTYEIGWDEPRR